MNDHDPIFAGFLRGQLSEGLALAGESDVLQLLPFPGDPPTRYVASFRGSWLAQDARGRIFEQPLAVFGIQFPRDYLRIVEPAMIVTVLEPDNLWHPNIRPPWICLGALPPGTGLVDLLYQCFEVLAYHKYSPHSALNEAAAQWARHQPPGRFPIDRRPFRRPPAGKEAAA
ncbi:MAG TPA: hypothetical protein VGO11_12260 [Chthoniobacteraceae bacterium]|jgi:hypothetical protein|nr:hypothetical protein [Chthoniobacteraceae bacterium]